ncbi:MAG TPA: S8 family serine peptidase [Bdellovibrionota bacterium]|nr:S8 family serine peptidase [Bdellovibrionota bacterium]
MQQSSHWLKFLIFSFLICSATETGAIAAIRARLTQQHAPGELVVKTRQSGAKRLLQSNAITTLQSRLGAHAVIDVKPFKTDRELLKVRMAKDEDVSKAVAILSAEPSVEYAEPNYMFYILDDGIPNDPDLVKTWGIHNTGQKDAAGQIGTPGSDIRVLPLWQQGFRGSRNIVAAVIDTGIQWDHPDLAANLYSNPGEAGDLATNGQDDDGNGFVDDLHGWNFARNNKDSNDDHGHGSHCAGTIGGVGNNGIGVSGVNWEVSLMPVKFLDASGGGTLQAAIEAVNYARMMKVNLMSNSWGGSQFAQSLSDAVKRTEEAGIIFVAAAGNDGTNNDTGPSYPANFPFGNIISVAATDNKDSIANFSNWGVNSVHVAAPGVQVYSTVKGGKYAAFSGTSMATPHIAGISALLLSVNPNWDFAEVKRRLITTSDPVRNLSRKVMAKGRVNAYNALHGIVPPSIDPDESLWKDVPVTIESVHPYAPKSDLTFNVEHPGAKYIRVHFEKIGTESGYDFVRLETRSGEVLEKISGEQADYMTTYIVGDSGTIRLTSDVSVNGYGFKVDRIQVIMP